MSENNNHAEPEKVTVAASALISMHSLSEPKRYILRTLTDLADLRPEQWPTDKVHLRRRRLSLYTLDADDQLRVFFERGADGRITIVDLARQDMLDHYFPGKSA